ncbi:uncharacterized protein K02A2.6-like [Diachasma alloeum]|uniref:uncharacterized protein K02A2.6-like n=1 Tax=Diachasma alloeum TaxID=454923 RepID=UPI0007382C8E|nr:uncharacterized protein K02A2.6-like [Diachasma alloeum]
MERDKVLTSIDQSDWATPAIFVKKPNGTIRVAGDYKVTVNSCIKSSEYQLPSSAEAMATLNGGTIFSQIDLKNAYKQLRVDEETANTLTLSTPKGLYKVNVLLDGLNIAPRIFQKFLVTRLQDIPGVLIYLDKIKIQGSTKEEHDIRLREVLRRLEIANLRINREKCVVGVESMEFLGYEVSSQGIRPLKKKIKAIVKMPAPTNVKELQAFLGSVNFHNQSLADRANIAEPLHRLLEKKTSWNWTERHQEAFTRLKQHLASAPILCHYDESKPIIVAADASPYGIGAILSHVDKNNIEHPVAFSSKTLSATQRNYSQLEREALTLIHAVTHYHQYLAGRKFKLITDHKPLLGIFNPNRPTPEIISPKLIRYLNTLRAYEYELEYREGRKNGNVDTLSRLPLEGNFEEEEEETYGEVLMIENVTRDPITHREIAEETKKEETLRQVKTWLQRGWPGKVPPQYTHFSKKIMELSIYKECIIWGHRVVIPTTQRKQMLKYLHANHPGICGTKAAARSYVWWPEIDQDIETMVKNCQECMEVLSAPAKTPTQPWVAPDKPWTRLHVDFAGPMAGPTFLIVVDSTTKWLEVKRVSSPNSLNVIKVLRALFATFGIPDTIVSDNGTAFTSEEIKAFYQRNGIKAMYIAPYNPQANGQAERMVQTAKRSLKKLNEGDWELKLARILLKQHSTPSTSTGASPAELMMGRKLRTALDKLPPNNEHETNKGYDSVKIRRLHPGDKVRMRTYRTAGPTWIVATVQEALGNRNYLVKERETGLIHKQEINQLVQLPREQDETPDTTDRKHKKKTINTQFYTEEKPDTEQEDSDESQARGKQTKDRKMKNKHTTNDEKDQDANALGMVEPVIETAYGSQASSKVFPRKKENKRPGEEKHIQKGRDVTYVT